MIDVRFSEEEGRALLMVLNEPTRTKVERALDARRPLKRPHICGLCGNETRAFAIAGGEEVCPRCSFVIADRHRNVVNASPLMPAVSVKR